MSEKVNWRKFQVHAVTSDSLVSRPDFFDLSEQVAASGLAAINLRAHGLTGRIQYETALRLREITSRYDCPLIVGGRPDIALAAGADAVQLGANTVPLEAAVKLCREHGLAFGYSCHSREESLAASRAGAAYIYLGTVFSSASKPGVAPCGTSLLAKIVEVIDIPIVAIGGIGPDNVAKVAAAGAAAAAAITSVWNAPDPAVAVIELAGSFGHNA